MEKRDRKKGIWGWLLKLCHQVYLTLLRPECSWFVEIIEVIGDSMKRWMTDGFSQHLHDEFKPKLEKLLEEETMIEADIPEKKEEIENFQKSLAKKKNYILTFLRTEGVSPDNAMERAVRPVKTKFKVSGLFKTETGSETYANIHLIVQTARKNG